MRKQDRLINLIQSLTPSEKKYFVQTAKAGGAAKSYLKLYEAMQQAGEYNATHLSRQLNKKKSDLANEKKYLEQVLLRALRLYYETDKEVALYNDMSVNLILERKQLHTYTRERLAKIRKQPGAQVNAILYAELCRTQMMMRYRETTEWFKNEKEIEQLTNEAKNSLQQTITYFDLNLLDSKINILKSKHLYATTPQIRKQVNTLLKNPLLKANYKPLYLQVFKLECLALLHMLNRNFAQAIKYKEKEAAVYENKPASVAATERSFYTCMGNLLQYYISASEFTKAEKLLHKISNRYYTALAYNHKKLDALFIPELEKDKTFLLLRQYRAGQASPQKVNEQLAQLHTKLKELERIMNPRDWVNTLYNAAKLHLLIGQKNECLQLLHRLIHQTHYGVALVAQANARLLQILAHQELGNYSILPSLVTSAKRFYQKNKLLTEVETTTFNFLNRLCKLPTAKEKKAAFLPLQKTYSTFLKNEVTAVKVNQPSLDLWAKRNL